MTRDIIVIIIAAALGVAMGKALDSAPIPPWVMWALLAVVLIVGLLVLQGQINL